MIVIRKANSAFPAHFSGVIKGLRPTLVVVETLTVVGMERGNGQIVVADSSRRLDQRQRLIANSYRTHMRTR